MKGITGSISLIICVPPWRRCGAPVTGPHGPGPVWFQFGVFSARAYCLQDPACRRGHGSLEPEPPGRSAIKQLMPASAYYNCDPALLTLGTWQRAMRPWTLGTGQWRNIRDASLPFKCSKQGMTWLRPVPPCPLHGKGATYVSSLDCLVGSWTPPQVTPTIR